MPKIAISYRRSDSADVTGRIFDRLETHYGTGTVFMDIDSIPFGVDFRQYFNDALVGTDVLLAIIGRQWAGDGDRRRIDEPNDSVRLEIEAALRCDIPIVPVLVNHAAMPPPDSLPESLANLAYRNAAEVDSGRDFRQHVDRLVRSIDRLLASKCIQPASADAKRQGESFRIGATGGAPFAPVRTIQAGRVGAVHAGRTVPSWKSVAIVILVAAISGAVLGYGAMMLAAGSIYLYFGDSAGEHILVFVLTSLGGFYVMFGAFIVLLRNRLALSRERMILTGLCWGVLAAVFYASAGSGALNSGALILSMIAVAEAVAPFIAAAFLPAGRSSGRMGDCM